MAKEPEIIKEKNQMRSWSRSMRSKGKILALVPTMGYLHDGHLSLIREAQKHAEIIVVSIYVNPAQFSPSEDLSTYPSDLDRDLKKLSNFGVDAVFHPLDLYDYGGCGETKNESVDKMEFTEEGEKKAVSCIEDKGEGRLGHETWIRAERLTKGLCGKSRPVFFKGVATVVTKLFNIVEPDIAIFGKKDYQQWRIICRMSSPSKFCLSITIWFKYEKGSVLLMLGNPVSPSASMSTDLKNLCGNKFVTQVRDLDFGIQVIGSDIVRETDGLAMSSRNVHLKPEEREKALSIGQSLLRAKLEALKGQTSCTELRNSVVQAITGSGGRVDYAEIVDQETLVAVEEIKAPVVFCVAAWFGKVRLIDNVEINI